MDMEKKAAIASQRCCRDCLLSLFEHKNTFSFPCSFLFRGSLNATILAEFRLSTLWFVSSLMSFLNGTRRFHILQDGHFLRQRSFRSREQAEISKVIETINSLLLLCRRRLFLFLEKQSLAETKSD